MNGVIRAALYARVSSQKQADDKTIDSQCQAIRLRIAEDELRLAEENTFCDDGYSGAELIRPALERLRDRVAAALIDRLYIHSPDRLARKMAHQALLLEEFRKYHCQVIFLNQQGLPDGPETNLLIQMQGIIAEYEREKIMERTRRGRRYSAACGNVSVFAGAPYGYRYISKSQGDGRARWEIDVVESQHVRLIFQLVDQQGCSLSAVTRELAGRSIKTRKGNAAWDMATVRGILINPAYTGRARYGKTRLGQRKPDKRARRGAPSVPRRARAALPTDPSEQVTISVPAIIDEATFERVGARMSENRKRQRERAEGAKHLLSGLLLCRLCGSAYCAHDSGSQYRYYRCIGSDKYRRQTKPLCTNQALRGAQLEQVVWSNLCQLLEDPQRLQVELERRRNEQKTPSDALEQRRGELAVLRGQLDRLIDAYASGTIDKSEFESRIVPLRERYDRENAMLASIHGQDDESIDIASAERAMAELAAQVQTRLSGADHALKRQLMKLLIKQVEISATEIRIVYKVPQHPFVLSPDKRGFLQHSLWLQATLQVAGPKTEICGDVQSDKR